MVFAGLAGSAGASKPYIHSGQGLNFECDVLDDMPHPSAFAYTLEKSSGMSFRASVTVHRRKHRLETLGKTIDTIGRKLFVLTNIEAHNNEFMSAN